MKQVKEVAIYVTFIGSNGAWVAKRNDTEEEASGETKDAAIGNLLSKINAWMPVGAAYIKIGEE